MRKAPTCVFGHVDQFVGHPGSVQGALDDGVRVADERVHRPVGGRTRVDVQQRHARRLLDCLSDRIYDLRTCFSSMKLYTYSKTF